MPPLTYATAPAAAAVEHGRFLVVSGWLDEQAGFGLETAFQVTERLVPQASKALPQETDMVVGDGATFAAGIPATFTGQGLDYETRAATMDALSWASSLDGELGYGASVSAVLSRGSHRITLSSPDHSHTIRVDVT